MALFTSPGNYVILNDFSDYTTSLNSKAVGIVGFASMGPTDVPTLITNQESLIKTFGAPNRSSGGQGLIGAYDLLSKTNSVWYVRAAAPSKLTSVGNISIGTQPHVAVSGLTQGYGYAFFIDVVNGAGVASNAESYVIGVPSGTNVIQDIQDTMASYMPKTADLSFHLDSSSLGYFVGNYAGTSATISVTAYATSSNGAIFSALGATGRAAGGGGAPLEGPNGVLSQPTQASVLAQAGVWAANLDHKMFATPGVHYTSVTGITAWENGSGTYATYQGSSVTSQGNTLISTSADGGAISLESLWTGAGYNYATSSTLEGLKTYGLVANVTSKQGKDSSVSFAMDGATEESYLVDFVDTADNSTNWVMDGLNTNSGNNSPTSRFYIAKHGYVGGVQSRYVGAATKGGPTVYGGTVAAVRVADDGTFAEGTANVIFEKLIDASLQFAYGVNGDVADEGGSLSDADILTSLIGSKASRTGMQGFLDESVNIAFLGVFGIHVQAVQDAAISLAAAEERFRFITSPPEGLPSEQRAVNWHNGLGDGRTSAINTRYASIQWPWTQEFDVFTGANDWFDPAIDKMKLLVSTKKPWDAPAGLERGKLIGRKDVEVVVLQGGRDLMYNGGNAINPIVKFPGEGIVMWGQRTAQRENTSLDRENVMDMVIQIRKDILKSTRQYSFRPSDPITWSQIVTAVKPYLQDIKDNRGLLEFSVVADSTTNTQARQERGEIWIRVKLTPVKTGEIVVFELNVTNQSGTTSIGG